MIILSYKKKEFKINKIAIENINKDELAKNIIYMYEILLGFYSPTSIDNLSIMDRIIISRCFIVHFIKSKN